MFVKMVGLALKRTVVPRSVVSPVIAQGRDGIAQAEFHLVGLAILVDGQPEVVGKCVDDGYTDAMEAARNLVRAVVELAAGVQDGHDDFRCGAPFLGMDVGRNAAAVIRDGHRLISVEW
jgi:hypothetical protein